MLSTKILPFAIVLPLLGCDIHSREPIIPNPFAPSKAELEAKKAQLDAKDDEVCKGYGARPGTDVYVQCRMSQSQLRVAADSGGGPVVVNNSASEPASYPKLQPIQQPVRCQSMGVGLGQVQTVCR